LGKYMWEHILVGGDEKTDKVTKKKTVSLSRDVLKDSMLKVLRSAKGASSYSDVKNLGYENAETTIHLDMPNGEGATAFMFLHGTNYFNIYGQVNKSKEIRDNAGALLEVQVDMKFVFEWNDRIDPNAKYSSDTWKSKIANVIYDPKDYDITVRWNRTLRAVFRVEPDDKGDNFVKFYSLDNNPDYPAPLEDQYDSKVPEDFVDYSLRGKAN